MQKLYKIEFYMPPPVDKWGTSCSFSHMRKSFAEGAWAMLKAHYNQRYEHRLVCDGVVIDTCGKQQVRVNVSVPKQMSRCDNCGKMVEISDGGDHGGCDFVYGSRGWRQLGSYDG